MTMLSEEIKKVRECWETQPYGDPCVDSIRVETRMCIDILVERIEKSENFSQKYSQNHFTDFLNPISQI